MSVQAQLAPHPTYHVVLAPGSGRWHVYRRAPGVLAVVHPWGWADREEARAAALFLAAAPHCVRCGAPCRTEFKRLDDLGTDLCLGRADDDSTVIFSSHILPRGESEFA